MWSSPAKKNNTFHINQKYDPRNVVVATLLRGKMKKNTNNDDQDDQFR